MFFLLFFSSSSVVEKKAETSSLISNKFTVTGVTINSRNNDKKKILLTFKSRFVELQNYANKQ